MKDKELLLFVVPFSNKIKPITDLEKEKLNNLSNHRAIEYAFTRGHVRDILSKLFGISPLDIPLESFPGKPPILKGELGNISISHCKDALFIGWSTKNIGVDIERKDRKFKSNNIAEKYFLKEERKELEKLSGEKRRLSILKLWVLKEAAIKYQRGTIMRDLSLWEINNKYTSAHHKSLNISLNTFCFHKKSWVLGIAHNSININYKDIIVDSN